MEPTVTLIRLGVLIYGNQELKKGQKINFQVMAKLMIKRKKELVNSMRNIEIYLDNSNLGTISNGKTEVFDLEPGIYKLKAKIDWCGSRVHEITLSDGDIKTIELSAYKHSSFLFPALIIVAILSIILSNIFQLDITKFVLLIFIPGLLYLLYHITFGRNEYLQLKAMD